MNHLRQSRNNLLLRRFKPGFSGHIEGAISRVHQKGVRARPSGLVRSKWTIRSEQTVRTVLCSFCSSNFDVRSSVNPDCRDKSVWGYCKSLEYFSTSNFKINWLECITDRHWTQKCYGKFIIRCFNLNYKIKCNICDTCDPFCDFCDTFPVENLLIF